MFYVNRCLLNGGDWLVWNIKYLKFNVYWSRMLSIIIQTEDELWWAIESDLLWVKVLVYYVFSCRLCY